MRGAYLLFLVISIAGLGFIDYRLKLAIFNKPQQAFRILLIANLLFILWDIAGIALGIFFIGDGSMLTGIRIGEFPLEELFFLTLLNYCSLIVYVLIKKQARP